MKNISENNWSVIVDQCNELDQMVTQTVIKACDIGDMLRLERVQMVAEKFNQQVLEKLSRSDEWARKMIDLSFKREAVQAALAEDTAPDSISGMHKHIKELPKMEAEKLERKAWPREKVGPAKGSGGRPKKTEEKKVKTKTTVPWTSVAEAAGVLTPNSGGGTRKKVKEALQAIDPEISFPNGGIEPAMVERVEAAAQIIYATKNPDKAKKSANKAAEELPVTAAKKLDVAIKKHKRILDAEQEAIVAERVQYELQVMLDMYNKESDKHQKVLNAYQGVMTSKEYKLVSGALHSDRYPNLDNVAVARIDKAFNIIREKKLELCGQDREESSTLPKTVSDLMAMKAAKKK